MKEKPITASSVPGAGCVHALASRFEKRPVNHALAAGRNYINGWQSWVEGAPALPAQDGLSGTSYRLAPDFWLLWFCFCSKSSNRDVVS